MRENFINLVLVTIFSGLAWPICVLAQPTVEEANPKIASKGYVLKYGEGEDTVGDGSSITKASPRTGTQGVVFVVDKMPASGTSGIHRHLEADEFFYVLAGSGQMLLGDEEHEIEMGDFVFVPFDTDHRITSSEDKPLHVIFVVDRPGLDEQFRAELQGLDRSKMTVEAFNEVVRKFGTVYKTFD